MKQADKYKLCVSPLTGEAYISSINEKKGVMTDNRIKLETGEVCGFIHQWVKANLEDDEDRMFIALRDGVKLVELKLIRNKDKTK
jgi:hypothetical protein